MRGYHSRNEVTNFVNWGQTGAIGKGTVSSLGMRNIGPRIALKKLYYNRLKMSREEMREKYGG
jgi:hypothetical protein